MPPSRQSVSVLAPAKINLFLRVLRLRPDGYHDIETIFQAIDLYDELVLEKANGPSTIEVPGFPGLETDTNLVIQAHKWIERHVRRSLSVRMRLAKRIPLAAGLGGGSSDAAAALVGLRAIFDLEISDDWLTRAAVTLGADVPFFLQGGTAVGEGIGERLTPCDLPRDYGLILLNPGIPVSTAKVFRELSASLTPQGREGTVWKLLEDRRPWEDLLVNDLQGVAERLHPEITRVRKALEDAGVTRVLMTGSGPTVFGMVQPDGIEEVRRRVPSEWSFHYARPVSGGVRIEGT